MLTDISPLRTAVIIGSTRPKRLGRAVGEWVAAAPGTGMELTLVDLADLGLPLLDEPAPAAWGDYARDSTRAWSELAGRFDAFVLVTPEYNHSTSAALKNALDHLYAEWRDKAVAFVGYGIDGGTRAVEHLRVICAELGMAGAGPQVSLRLADDFPGGACSPGEGQVRARARMMDALARWAGALRPLRAASPDSRDGGRPVLDRPELRPAAAAAVRQLAADLQAGLDASDADRYDSRLAADVLWGSPYGATLAGTDSLLPAHRSLMAAAAAPPSRFEVAQLLAPAPGVAIAHIRRRALDAQDGFSEMALYMLVERDGRWWLAAAQNTPIAEAAR
jgi:uncharacterized protein (TIGR02246 family)